MAKKSRYNELKRRVNSYLDGSDEIEYSELVEEIDLAYEEKKISIQDYEYLFSLIQ